MKIHDTNSLSLFWQYAVRHKRAIILLSFVYIVSTALLVLAPQTLSRFIDRVHGSSQWKGWIFAILLYLAAMLGKSVMAAVLDYQLASVGQRFTDDYRSGLMSHYLSLDSQRLSALTSGEMLTRLNEDVKGLFNYYYILFYKLAGSALALAGILFMLFMRVSWLSAILLLASLLSILGFKIIQDRGIPKYVNQARANASFNSLQKEILDNSPVLRGLRNEAYADIRMHDAMKIRYRESFPANIMYANLWSASTVVEAVMIATGLILSLLLWDRFSISLGQAYLIYTYCDLVSAPLQDFRNHMGDMQSSRAGIIRCQEFLDLPVNTGKGNLILKNNAITLAVRDLHFSYRNNPDPDDLPDTTPEILKGLNLTVPAGSKIGIMGETGCGKSTLLGIIAGFLNFSQGSVRLNDIETGDIDLRNLRQRVAYCTQRVQLIHGTIRDNISFFNDEYSDREIWEAVGLLGLEKWLNKFPQGLDTHLEMGEGNLSQGEAQLLSLIRLSLKKPGLVLLDEISSNLDALTERRVLDSVKILCSGPTVLAIAHRIESLDWMDTIIRMENGVLLEGANS